MYEMTPQLRHQREDLERSRDATRWAWFWEQGTGKSKQAIDTAAHLWDTGKIEQVLVLAPNGVHANFCDEEVQRHLPRGIPAFAAVYRTKRCKTRDHRELMGRVLAPGRERELRFLAMSYDAIKTADGRALAESFVRHRPTMLFADESSAIKTPKSQKTIAAMALAKLAPYRRIADGTPYHESPFDVYAQMMFLDQEFWKQYGLSSFFVFRTMFGTFVRRKAAQGHQYDHHTGFQNLEYLGELLRKHGSRYLKTDCLDLPPKTYKRITFEMTKKQQLLYEQVAAHTRVEIAEGVDVKPQNAMVRLLRLQQIASGYVVGHERVDVGGAEAPATPEEAIQRLIDLMYAPDPRRVQDDIMPPDENPRLQCLLDYLETVHHKCIIWCRFKRDVDLIAGALGTTKAKRYDGDVSDASRTLALQQFKDPSGPQFLVVNMLTLSRGVTLTCAKTVIYYTNDFRLINRLQSEDRAHRIGQDAPVMFVDIVCEGTVDEHISECLRQKLDIARMISGDKLGEWLSKQHNQFTR